MDYKENESVNVVVECTRGFMLQIQKRMINLSSQITDQIFLEVAHLVLSSQMP